MIDKLLMSLTSLNSGSISPNLGSPATAIGEVDPATAELGAGRYSDMCTKADIRPLATVVNRVNRLYFNSNS